MATVIINIYEERVSVYFAPEVPIPQLPIVKKVF